MNHEQVINSIPLFENLTKEHKVFLEDLIFTQQLQKGEVLFLESEEALAVFFVTIGKIRLSKSTSDGKEIVLHVRKDGDMFAATSIFSKPGETYPATATAIEPTTVSFIRKADFEQLLLRTPELALPIFQTMSERLRLSQKTLRDVALFGKQNSLASTLLRFAKDYGRQASNGTLIDLKLTHEELGSYFGATRESVNRMINQLKKDGIISMDHGYITIHQKDYLEELLNN
ncbi:Crp/Fnr family transcriptional regulator [Bacillus alkalicellulosilyticus]|uniref:Crp/Fnr family transcriptional regulator n=1 Tax=Alkalihalobacterium alkalicellulosilyticum TaxID=1912214 RepID=UPI00099778A6|nr:Crp/Fnr family transcriptional regulator [Bacillus alkalicellulosilyticus]